MYDNELMEGEEEFSWEEEKDELGNTLILMQPLPTSMIYIIKKRVGFEFTRVKFYNLWSKELLFFAYPYEKNQSLQWTATYLFTTVSVTRSNPKLRL